MKTGWGPLLQVAGYLGAAYVAYRMFQFSRASLAQTGQAVSTSLIDYFHKPGGTASSAAQISSEYGIAVQKIVDANPQFTPRHVKRLLIYFGWKLGDPMPAGSGLNTPPGM